MSSMMPKTYAEWHHCITKKCRIQLTSTYIEQRIAVFSDEQSDEARSFRALYGDFHRRAVLGWFERARNEIN